MLTPAENLESVVLKNGWVVGSKLVKSKAGTGGAFSTGYFVTHPDGRVGFLKAMDYSRAFGAPDFLDRMKSLADTYIFEREICVKCQAAGVTRVIHAIDHGFVEGSGAPMTRVEYLIFERADCDVREFLDRQPDFDVAFALRTLHGISAALQQMHGADMAHQDVKPSNVLVFAAERKWKLGDLGRAWAKGIPAPHDAAPFAGDPNYAPIELCYAIAMSDQDKRFGYDMYLLGSLVVFLFCRVHINALILKHLPPVFANHRSTYNDALPYLQAAFTDALREFASHVPQTMQERLVTIVTELCNPDYTMRGNPVKTGQNRYSLARYISQFDLLSRQAEIENGVRA